MTLLHHTQSRLAVAWALATMPTSAFLVSISGFWAGVPLTQLHPILAIALSTLLASRLDKPAQRPIIFWAWTAMCIIFYGALTILIQVTFTDLSWDGRQYHAEAIAQIALGWNPIQERLLPDQWGYGDPSVWLNSMPKFTWIVGALTYLLANDISASKIIGIYFTVPLFYIVLVELRAHFDKTTSILSALAIVFNPIVSSQLFTNYIDGVAYLLLVLLAAAAFGRVTRSLLGTLRPWIILIVAVSAVNVKLTNLIPIVFIFFIFIFLNYKLVIKKTRFSFILAAFLFVNFFSFTPYLTNTFRYGNPAYPIYSEPLLDSEKPSLNIAPNDVRRFIGDSNHPILAKATLPESFAISVFSTSANDTLAPSLKFPGSVRFTEWMVFGTPDVRVGGFGPLFSLALLISILGLVIGLLDKNFYSRYKFPLITILGLLLIALFTPNSWWARYVPYVWVLPVIILLTLSNVQVISGRAISIVGFSVLLLNAFGVLGVATYSNVIGSRFYRQVLENSIAAVSTSAPRGIKCDFNKDLIDLRKAGLPFFCTHISTELLIQYTQRRDEWRSLIDFYTTFPNGPANLTNNVSSTAHKPPSFYGELSVVDEFIDDTTKRQLSEMFKIPLRYKIDRL